MDTRAEGRSRAVIRRPCEVSRDLESDEDRGLRGHGPRSPGASRRVPRGPRAFANISEAVAGYVESMRERDEPIPPSINEEVIDIAV